MAGHEVDVDVDVDVDGTGWSGSMFCGSLRLR